MTRQYTHSSLASFSCLTTTVIMLTVLAAAGNAQSILLTALPPGQAAAVTAPYPVGTPDPAYRNVPFLYGPFTVAAGSTAVTFTATTTAAGAKSFESFSNDGSLDFPVNTQLVDTGVADNNQIGNTPTGPLRIDFSAGVSAFGLYAEDNAFDSETFTFTVYTGGSSTNGTTFTTPAYDNAATPTGQSVFLGAQAVGGAVITSVLLSSASMAVDGKGGVSTANSNDFYVGPLSTYAAVPETSTLVSFGLLLAFSLGAALASAGKGKKT